MWRGRWFSTFGVRACAGGGWQSLRWLDSLSHAVVLFVASLTAEAGAAEMEFEVPRQCGSELDFRRDLSELAGLASAPLVPTLVRITPAEPGSYRLHLEVAGEIREIADPDCRVLLRTAVVIAAAAARGETVPTAEPPPAVVDPSSPPPLGPALPSEAPPAPEEQLLPASEPSSASPTTDDVSSAQTALSNPTIEPTAPLGARAVEPTRAGADAAAPGAPAAQSQRLGAGAFALAGGIGLSAGILPGASAVLELRAGLDPDPVGLVATVRYWPGSGTERNGRSVHVTGLGGRIATLMSLGAALHASVGLEVDRLSGSGQEGVSGRDTDSAWGFAAALDLNAIPWSIENIRLEVGVGAQLALVRPAFVVTGFGEVYQVPPVAGAAIIRGVWLFR